MFELKNTDGLCVMTLKCELIFKEKLTGGLKNDKDFGYFLCEQSQVTLKSEILEKYAFFV